MKALLRPPFGKLERDVSFDHRHRCPDLVSQRKCQGKKDSRRPHPLSISVLTYMELIQGMKSKNEFKLFQRQVNRWNTDIIQIDKEISSRGMFYVQEYSLSHSMFLADALIAATVVQNSEKLLTANDGHYRFIPNIECLKFKPTGL